MNGGRSHKQTMESLENEWIKNKRKQKRHVKLLAETLATEILAQGEWIKLVDPIDLDLYTWEQLEELFNSWFVYTTGYLWWEWYTKNKLKMDVPNPDFRVPIKYDDEK